jgi:hypothetical protein
MTTQPTDSPVTCPTCGSNDPDWVRLSDGGSISHRHGYCPDDFHGVTDSRSGEDDLIDRLREPRLGVHYITDDAGRETGETVDEYKPLPQLQAERDEAAAEIAALREALERITNVAPGPPPWDYMTRIARTALSTPQEPTE